MGVTIFDPIWSQRPHASRLTIELLHVLKGRLRLILPRHCLVAEPGDTLLVPTNVVHRDEFDFHNGLEIFMIHFRWKAEKLFFQRVPPRGMPSLPANVKTEIGMIMDHLRSDISRGTEGDRVLAGVRLMTVLLLLLRTAAECKTGRPMLSKQNDIRQARRRLLMAQAREYLEQRFAEPVTLDHIAKTLGVSSYYLSHVFSEESDFSLFAYLTTLRMEKARALLADRQFNVKQVAHAVGYDDSNYFSRVFHRYFGFPPHSAHKLSASRPRPGAIKSSK